MLNSYRGVPHAVRKGLTSRKLFALRFFLMSWTHALVIVTLMMTVSFNPYIRYYFEVVQLMSYAAMLSHYAINVEHKPLYDNSAVLEMKPLYESGKLRKDRLFQVLISAKLQFYLHMFCVFGWETISYLQGVDGGSLGGAMIGWAKFTFGIAVYYLIIRRMCASLRDRMETSNDNGKQLKEELIMSNFGLLGIVFFLCFEVVGCVSKHYYESGNRGDLER